MLDKLTHSADVIPGASVVSKDDPAKVKDAAKQFEALLLGQMLKSMHEGGGWLDKDSDESSSSVMECAQESFAQSLASSGGLGLASTLVKGFQQPPQA